MNPNEVPPAYVRQVGQVESGGNPQARAKSSSATGLYQFTDGTWSWLRSTFPKLALTKDGRTDPAQSERALRQFTALNAQVLQGATGKLPSNGDLYLAHFLGSAVAVKIITAPAGNACAPVVGAAVVKANHFIAGMSCGGLRSWAAGKMGEAANAQPALPSRRRSEPLTAEELNHVELLRHAEGTP